MGQGYKAPGFAAMVKKSNAGTLLMTSLGSENNQVQQTRRIPQPSVVLFLGKLTFQ
jgi:hypothetical protein